jgi:hypothetical protein
MGSPNHKRGVLASMLAVAHSMRNLGRAFKGEEPIIYPDDIEPAPMPEPELPAMLAAPQPRAEDAQLLTQRTPGWHVPHPSRLPVPTYAPVMTAFGIVFIALGAVTVWPLSVIGAVIFVLAIAKWIGELLHD